jgi:hypothetical protein
MPQAKSDFWSVKGKGELQTVELTRKLPPVAARNGRTVKFVPEIAGTSIPPETATILREKIRTLLLHAKAGEIQLVDGPADTVIKCIITGYEPKILHSSERQVGLHTQQIRTWIGNLEASVQVLDNRENPIDAGNIKFHLERDFVTAQREENVTSLTDKRTSWRDKMAGSWKTLKGGADLGDIAAMAGGGQQLHNALAKTENDAREPTDLEWRDALMEGMAAKVANRIVPVDQEFKAILPLDKEFAQIRDLAKSGRWGDVREQTEKMPPLQGANEAYRLYTLGLSYEAIACGDDQRPEEAVDLLNKASKYYDDARKMKPSERELLLAQIRVQDSLDHYLEVEHYLASRKGLSSQRASEKALVGVQPGAATMPGSAAAQNVANNAALIALQKAGMPEGVLTTFVNTASEPKFDVSANGLIELGLAKIPGTVIEAVQKRMTPTGSNRPSHRAPVNTRPVPAAHVQ